MVILISGCTHTGKTYLSSKLLEKYKIPYLSIDHLKMGLIRSHNTKLTVFDDEKLTEFLWPILREIIKTVIENKQDLIIEGCYIPFSWKDDFSELYLKEIKDYFLIMSENYIKNNFAIIKSKANIIENRIDDGSLKIEDLIKENKFYLENVKKYKCNYILIDKEYDLGVILND